MAALDCAPVVWSLPQLESLVTLRCSLRQLGPIGWRRVRIQQDSVRLSGNVIPDEPRLGVYGAKKTRDTFADLA
jgi:hypothetical protein